MSSQTAPTVSIIIPCFNQGKYLNDALQSVVNQSWQDWECMIVNDGSTDDTHDIAMHVGALDKRFKYIKQENRGLAGARNRGVRESRGRYIQFLDSDDLLLPTKLETQVKLLRSTGELSISYCDYYYCDDQDKTKRIFDDLYPKPVFCMRNPLHDMALRWEDDLSLPPHCFLFDARFFREKGVFFDESLPNHEDWDCWMKILRLQPRIFPVDDELAIYRAHTQSMSRQHKKMRDGFIAAVRNQKKRFKNDRVMQGLLDAQLAKIERRYQIPTHFAKRREAIKSKLQAKFRKLYCSIIPWPIQKVVTKIGTIRK
jgi:glycosyltransferase involved in cell wall biosynthesis